MYLYEFYFINRLHTLTRQRGYDCHNRILFDKTEDVIPLFQTGHESPLIDFFYSRRGGEGFARFHYFFFLNRDVLRVSPDSDTMSLRIFGGFGSIRLESRKNSLRLAK